MKLYLAWNALNNYTNNASFKDSSRNLRLSTLSFLHSIINAWTDILTGLPLLENIALTWSKHFLVRPLVSSRWRWLAPYHVDQRASQHYTRNVYLYSAYASKIQSICLKWCHAPARRIPWTGHPQWWLKNRRAELW